MYNATIDLKVFTKINVLTNGLGLPLRENL